MRGKERERHRETDTYRLGVGVSKKSRVNETLMINELVEAGTLGLVVEDKSLAKGLGLDETNTLEGRLACKIWYNKEMKGRE